MNITSINLFVLVTIPLMLWLGFTGRVDWIIIGLLWLMEINIDVRLKG